MPQTATPTSREEPKVTTASAVQMKSILLTGAAGSIGSATVRKLIKSEYLVYAGAIDDWETGKLESLAKELETDRLIPVPLDIRDSAQIEAAVSRIESEHPELAAVIANGAACPTPNPFEMTDFDSFDDVIKTNIGGNARLIYRSLELLKKSKGRIIFVSSLHGLIPLGMGGAYTMSKHANEAMCTTLRRELGYYHGIHVSVVNPGGVKGTYMVASAFDEVRQFIADCEDRSPEELHPADLDRGGNTRLIQPKLERNSVYLPAYRKFLPNLFAVYDSGQLNMLSDSEENALAIMKALEADKPKTRYLTGWDAKILYFLSRILPPTWIDRIILKAFYTQKS